MLQKEIDSLKDKFPDHSLYTLISYDLVNNFTIESVVEYLQNTYNVNIPDRSIHGDPSGYGRGSILLTESDFRKIPLRWEARLSETFDELEFTEEEI